MPIHKCVVGLLLLVCAAVQGCIHTSPEQLIAMYPTGSSREKMLAEHPMLDTTARIDSNGSFRSKRLDEMAARAFAKSGEQPVLCDIFNRLVGFNGMGIDADCVFYNSNGKVLHVESVRVN